MASIHLTLFIDMIVNKIKLVWNNITVEPVFFLYALSLGCYVVVTKKLYLDKVNNQIRFVIN